MLPAVLTDSAMLRRQLTAAGCEVTLPASPSLLCHAMLCYAVSCHALLLGGPLQACHRSEQAQGGCASAGEWLFVWC